MKRSVIAGYIHLALLSALALGLAGCVSWRPGWKEAQAPAAAGDAAQLLLAAEALEDKAGDAQKLAALIDAYKAVTAADPGNYRALWKTCNYHILMGAAYSDGNRDRKRNYTAAVQYCEKAMYTNRAFKEAVDRGEPVWKAVEGLTVAETDAMGYWYTARLYYFKECLWPIARLFNTGLVRYNEPVMKRIDALDPDWAGGGNLFSRAVYFIAAPERFGGSKKKAEEYMAKAIEAGPNYLVNRWGRAKYLYSIIGNQAGYESDLKWVLAQDPHNSGNPYPWNVYFQRQAADMLAEKAR